nr:MAG TPA: hypothetical protein [Caudoviricetes sp.]
MITSLKIAMKKIAKKDKEKLKVNSMLQVIKILSPKLKYMAVYNHKF